MKTHRHRRHSMEFKLRIVKAYLNGEGSIKGVARQHDISHNLLRIWLEKLRRGELTEEVDRKERIREYEVDPLLCPCGERMRVVGFIAQAPVIRKILTHIGRHFDPLKLPGRSPSL